MTQSFINPIRHEQLVTPHPDENEVGHKRVSIPEDNQDDLFVQKKVPSFMKPTKSSVVKGSIAPNVGTVADAELLRSFHDTIRGDTNKTADKALDKKLSQSVIEPFDDL